MNGFYLIWAFNFQKNSIVPYKIMRVEKKFLRNWTQRVSKESEFCADLHQEVPKDFFLRKGIFAKISKSLKIQFFWNIFFPFCQTQDFCALISAKFRFFGYPVRPVSKWVRIQHFCLNTDPDSGFFDQKWGKIYSWNIGLNLKYIFFFKNCNLLIHRPPFF